MMTMQRGNRMQITHRCWQLVCRRTRGPWWWHNTCWSQSNVAPRHCGNVASSRDFSNAPRRHLMHMLAYWWCWNASGSSRQSVNWLWWYSGLWRERRQSTWCQWGKSTSGRLRRKTSRHGWTAETVQTTHMHGILYLGWCCLKFF